MTGIFIKGKFGHTQGEYHVEICVPNQKTTIKLWESPGKDASLGPSEGTWL